MSPQKKNMRMSTSRAVESAIDLSKEGKKISWLELAGKGNKKLPLVYPSKAQNAKAAGAGIEPTPG